MAMRILSLLLLGRVGGTSQVQREPRHAAPRSPRALVAELVSWLDGGDTEHWRVGTMWRACLLWHRAGHFRFSIQASRVRVRGVSELLSNQADPARPRHDTVAVT